MSREAQQQQLEHAGAHAVNEGSSDAETAWASREDGEDADLKARRQRRRLTFELSRERRYGAWPAGRMMYHSGRRAKCHAGASRLQRRVRRRRVRSLYA
jgi:hypothetical protein